MDPFDDDEAPPPYSPGPGVASNREAFDEHHIPDADHTFDCIENNIAAAKHCDKIRRHGHDKYIIERASRTAHSSGATISGDFATSEGVSHITFYANNCRIGTVVLPQNKHRDDIAELYLGSIALVKESGLKATRNGLLNSASYEFEAGSTRFAWRYSHGRHLLGGFGDWSLEDLSAIGSIAPAHRREGARWVPNVITGGRTIAVFHARTALGIHGKTSEHVVGQVKWADEHGEKVELMALLALAVILQKG